jgi:hypothetical protein
MTSSLAEICTVVKALRMARGEGGGSYHDHDRGREITQFAANLIRNFPLIFSSIFSLVRTRVTPKWVPVTWVTDLRSYLLTATSKSTRDFMSF